MRFSQLKRLEIIILLLILNFCTSNAQSNDVKTSDSTDNDEYRGILLVGYQFYQQDEPYFTPALGGSINLYKNKHLQIPLEFIIYYTRWDNKHIFFPRISSAIKYLPGFQDFDHLFIQGGLGIPFITNFYYPFEIYYSVGFSFQPIQIEFREIYYFEYEGNKEIHLTHWPMFTLLLGIQI